MHHEEEGPLGASMDVGGTSILPPSETPWHGTFGSYFLCSYDSEAEIELERVVFDAGDPPPLGVEVILRKGGATEEAYGVISHLGRPDEALQQGDRRLDGEFTDVIEGQKVAVMCGEPPSQDNLSDIAELLVVMKADERGAIVDSVSIQYTADGKPFQLDVMWQLVLCGDFESEMCPADAQAE